MSEIDVVTTQQSIVVDSASKSAHVISTISPISVSSNRTASKLTPAVPQPINVNPSGADILVLHHTQQIVVNPEGNTFSVVNAGPIGSRGPIGPSWPITIIDEGELLTKVGGDLISISRADLAADIAFTSGLTAHVADSDPHPGYVTTAEGAALITAHQAVGDPHTQYVLVAGDNMTGALWLQVADAALTIGTSLTSRHHLMFASSIGDAVGAPTFTTRSGGTKIVMWPALDGANVDYGMGIDGYTLWYSIPAATATYKHNWYAGVTSVMSVDGVGKLLLGGNITTSDIELDNILGTARIGKWSTSAYAQFSHKDGLSTGYGLLTTSTATYISTGSATGTISLRPGDNDTTYALNLSGTGAHTMAADSFVYTSSQTGVSNVWAFRIHATGMAGGANDCLSVGGFSGDTSICLASTLVYNRTSTGAANVTVDTGGRVRRSTSSRRYKDDIVTWKTSLDTLMAVRPVSWMPKSDIATDKEVRVIGFIAEEMYELAPEVVLLDEQGRPDALNYNGVIAMLVNALQELTDRVTVLGG